MSRPRLWLVAAAEAVLLLGLWVLFTASPSLHEVIFGAVAALIAAVAAAVVRGDAGPSFAVIVAAVRAGVRVPLDVVLDTCRVLAELARVIAGKPPRSRLVSVPFARPDDDPRAALAAALVSVSPNSIVLGVEKGRMFVHQLRPQEAPEVARELGGGS